MQLSIDETGKVIEISVLKADPPGHFEESALNYFREAKFAPGMKDGIPEKRKIMIRVEYDSTGAKNIAKPAQP